MSELTARTLVRCPVSEGTARLSRSLRSRDTSDGHQPLVTFQVDSSTSDGGSRLRGSGIVTASVAPMGADSELSWFYKISWSSAQGGAAPAFAGCLCIEPHTEYNAFYLRLTGDYTESQPPADLARLDIGHTLAKETISAMLLAIANDIEQQYRLDERAKIARAKRPLSSPHN